MHLDFYYKNGKIYFDYNWATILDKLVLQLQTSLTVLLYGKELYVNYEVFPKFNCSAKLKSHTVETSTPRDCMTLTMVVGLVWSNEARSYAGGSIATGRASHGRLVRDEDPD